ncbi:MAG: hypothetical protein GQ565_05580 [Candidatus Aegiribacteria sp.]|nr:hypothetical protein [Candidatus Aegiribacteria sp.]
MMGKILMFLPAALLLISTGCDDSTYPFDQVTEEFNFTYDLPNEGVVNLIVLNCYMNNVRTLLSDTTQPTGSHTSSWDLKDLNGARVPDGLYYIRIKLDDNVIETKMYEVHK